MAPVYILYNLDVRKKMAEHVACACLFAGIGCIQKL